MAERAGVTAQTIYNVVGSKQQLLKAAYDVTLAGDDEPMSLAERPEVVRMYALLDATEFLHAYAALGRGLLERVGPLMLQIAAGAAAGEADLVEHQRVTDSERLVGTGMVVRRVTELGALRPGTEPRTWPRTGSGPSTACRSGTCSPAPRAGAVRRTSGGSATR